MIDHQSISIGILPTFLLFGVLQGLLIAGGLLMHKNGRKLSNRLLSLLLFVLSFHLIEYLNITTGLYLHFTYLIGFSVPLFFLIGPIFYLYTLSLHRRDFRMNVKMTIHFVPAMLCYVILVPFYILDSVEKSNLVTEILRNGYVTFPIGQFLILTLSTIQMLAYYYVTHSFVRVKEEESINKFSNPDVIYGSWFRQTSIGFSLYMLLYFMAYFQLFFVQSNHNQVFYAIMLFVSFFVHFIGFNAIRNPKIFISPEYPAETPKYQKTAIKKDISKTYAEQLLVYMESEKPYLNAELKLVDVANSLSIEPYQLSQVINSEFKKNFFDFVNEYRIEEAKLRMLDPKFRQHTLLAIAMDVGFNNKSSFNRVFKKHTNNTPSNFIRMHSTKD